ncbi:MAG: hypothetical protein K6A42_07700 [Treponema sp.]|nr:hypothetical protein [Treponema sp.]
MKITAVCLSPTIQRTVSFKTFLLNKVNRSEKYGVWASGKAVNAARVFNQLESGSVRVVCPLGEENQKRFTEFAERDMLLLSPVTIPGNTRECWTVLDKSAKTTTELVVGEPAVEKLPQNKVDELMDAVNESLSDSDALLLAGSRPAIWPDELSCDICKAACDLGKITLVDFWGDDLKRTLKVCEPTIVKINEEEFFSTFGGKSGVAGLKSALTTASKKRDTIFIVTRGDKATYAAQRGKVFEADTEKNLKIVNTTACGDAFAAGFLHEYLKSGDIQAALKKGTWCGARNAENECPGSLQ